MAAEASEREGGRQWVRPLGLLALAVTLTVGQPLIVVVVAFALLTFLAPGGRNLTRILAAVAFAMVFAGVPQDGFWYVERGWAVLVAGGFVAASLLWPQRSFLVRGLMAVVLGSAFVGLIVLALRGWNEIEWMIADRVQQSVSASLQMLAALSDGEVDTRLRETLAATARMQGVIFPALIALSSLASLGVAWWIHARVSALPMRGLGPLREFRFPNEFIWVFIVGLGLVLLAEWSTGWGRLGSNLLAFMGALYMLRGAGVLLFLSGGMGVAMGMLLAIGLLLATPVLAIGAVGAMLIGVGDSWFDLRRRIRESAGGAR